VHAQFYKPQGARRMQCMPMIMTCELNWRVSTHHEKVPD